MSATRLIVCVLRLLHPRLLALLLASFPTTSWSSLHTTDGRLPLHPAGRALEQTSVAATTCALSRSLRCTVRGLVLPTPARTDVRSPACVCGACGRHARPVCRASCGRRLLRQLGCAGAWPCLSPGACLSCVPQWCADRRLTRLMTRRLRGMRTPLMRRCAVRKRCRNRLLTLGRAGHTGRRAVRWPVPAGCRGHRGGWTSRVDGW
jgi:hypothetical protein